MPPQTDKRPTVPVRHQTFVMITEMIREIQALYEETPSERVLQLLNKAKRLKGLWWDEEDGYCEQEFLELLRDLRKYPHTIRLWAVDEDLH